MKMKKSYKLGKRVLSFFLILSMISMVLIPREIVMAANYGGVVYNPDYSTWKQGNSAWGSKKLGELCNMANSGCLITSIAILMAKSGAEDPNIFCPGTLRDRYESRGFISHHSSDKRYDGNLNNIAYSRSNSPDFYQIGASDFRPTPFAQIYSKVNSMLNQGYYAVIQVRHGGHYVAANYCRDGEIYIHDPASDGFSKLSSYDGGIDYAIYFKANNKGNGNPDFPQNVLPNGCIDSVTGGVNCINLSGWAFDYDSVSTSIEVHAYIGGAWNSGAPGYRIKADKYRPDVNNAYKGVGSYHGFNDTIKTTQVGNQTVYIYAINTTGGDNTLLGTRTVNITTDTSKPVISNVKVSNVSSDGYTVTCTVTDNVGVTKAEFPTWPSADNSGNPIWHAGSISGNTASCRINRSEHGNKYGNYVTHIYVYDAAGNIEACAVPKVVLNAECNHNYQWITDKSATCSSTGSKHQECSLCHAKGSAEIIPKTSHQYGNWVVTKAATEYATGLKERKCVYCNSAKETAIIPKLASSKKLSTPKLGKVVSAGYNKVTIAWSKVSGAAGYEIYQKDGNVWKKVGIVNSRTSSFVRSGLTCGKNYTFTVRAYAKADGKTYTSAYDTKGITGKPMLSTPAIKNIKVYRTSVKMTWKSISGASGYVVYRKTGSENWKRIATIKNRYAFGYTDKTAKNGKKYSYTVRAYRVVNGKNVYSDYNKTGKTVKK